LYTHLKRKKKRYILFKVVVGHKVDGFRTMEDILGILEDPGNVSPEDDVFTSLLVEPWDEVGIWIIGRGLGFIAYTEH
jgi:hypothetical protein